MTQETTSQGTASEQMAPERLLQVENLVKHFPITKGIFFRKQIGAVQAGSAPLQPGSRKRSSSAASPASRTAIGPSRESFWMSFSTSAASRTFAGAVSAPASCKR